MFITVFTPTYNRAYILGTLYESLLKQTASNFEWLIVDDGSSDSTKELVTQWQNDSKTNFLIRYIYQDNAGKHVAWNVGVQEAKGELVFFVDSDDYISSDAIEKIVSMEETIADKENYMGVSGVRVFPGNEATGGILKEKEYIDYFSINRRSKGINGDLCEAFYTDKLKRYPFPVFKGEKFVPEALIFNRFSNDGLMIRGFYQPIYFCEYLPDGYTKNTNNLLISNWKGYSLYVKELMDSKVSIAAKIIPLCGYIYRSILRLFRPKAKL